MSIVHTAGSTRHVAQVIGEQLKTSGIETTMVDLGEKGMEPDALYAPIAEAGPNCCLFVGSPVYGSLAVGPVMDFIAKMPEGTKALAAPFVTWGCATSGIAVYLMGKALQEKGCSLAGAATVPALHSFMWRTDNPLGQGRPDAEDDSRIRSLAAKVADKMSNGVESAISLSALAYQAPEVHREMEAIPAGASKKKRPGREVDEALCTECGVCADACPADAVTFSPYPVFGETCIGCFNCVRLCPEEAIKTDLSKLMDAIRTRSQTFLEEQATRVFV